MRIGEGVFLVDGLKAMVKTFFFFLILSDRGRKLTPKNIWQKSLQKESLADAIQLCDYLKLLILPMRLFTVGILEVRGLSRSCTLPGYVEE